MPRGVYIRTKPNGFLGKHHTQESRDKMSKSKLGKSRSEAVCQRLREVNSGENHPMFGKHHSEESRKKMRSARLGKYKGELNPMFGKQMSDASKQKISYARSEKYTGDKHPSWKGGTSFIPYCEKFNEKRKKAVRKFFNNLCICTGERQYNRELSVHHIDHDKDQGCNGKPFNLVPMSSEHHSKEIYNEEEYKAYINKTLEEGFKWGIWNKQEYMEKVMY